MYPSPFPVDRRLLRLHPHGRKSLLACFHHAGAGAAAFAGWPRQFADQADVVRVQLPGREDRLGESLQQSLPDLAATIAMELAGAPYGRLVLFGHSMGATLAWWVAACLWLRHGSSTHVVVSSRAPRGAVMPCEGMPSRLEDWFERLGEQPPAALADPQFRELLSETLVADQTWMAREFDRPMPMRLPLPVTALCGNRDGLVTPAQMEAWRSCTDADFELHTLPGGHLHILANPEPVKRILYQLLASEPAPCHPK